MDDSDYINANTANDTIYVYNVIALSDNMISILLLILWDMRSPPLKIKMLHEPNPLNSRISVRRLALAAVLRSSVAIGFGV